MKKEREVEGEKKEGSQVGSGQGHLGVWDLFFWFGQKGGCLGPSPGIRPPPSTPEEQVSLPMAPCSIYPPPPMAPR